MSTLPSHLETGPYAGFFHQGQGGSKAYMPKKVPKIQRIINDILKIVNIVFYPPPPPPVCWPRQPCYKMITSNCSRLVVIITFSEKYVIVIHPLLFWWFLQHCLIFQSIYITLYDKIIELQYRSKPCICDTLLKHSLVAFLTIRQE